MTVVGPVHTAIRPMRFRAVAAIGIGIVLLAFLAPLALRRPADRGGLQTLTTVHLPGQGAVVALSSSAGKFVLLNRDQAWLCNAGTGTPIASLNNPPGHSLGRTAISTAAQKVAVASGDGTLSVFHLGNGALLWSLQVTRLQFSDVRFFPSGGRLAVSDGVWLEPEENRGAIRIYDAHDGTLERTIDQLRHSVMGMSISPDEKWLCARFNYGGQIAVWNLPDLRPIRRFGFRENALGGVKDPSVRSLDISHDSACVAAGGEGAFGVWSLATGAPLLTVEDAGRKFDVKFHPTEPTLWAVSSDAVQVWKRDGEDFVKQSTTPVQLKDRRYFADDAPTLCILEKDLLTLYRLPSP